MRFSGGLIHALIGSNDFRGLTERLIVWFGWLSTRVSSQALWKVHLRGHGMIPLVSATWQWASLWGHWALVVDFIGGVIGSPFEVH